MQERASAVPDTAKRDADAASARSHDLSWSKASIRVAETGLTLHPDKTDIGDCRQAGQGFEFPDYRHGGHRA